MMQRSFMGYVRPDGGVGIRNHVLVLPCSVCASDTAEKIAREVPGVITFHNQNGCSQVPGDQQLTMDVLAGFAANPNVYGTILVSLGCENCQLDLVKQEIQKRTNKPLAGFVIQACGGTPATVEKAAEAARRMLAEAAKCERTAVPLSRLIVGTECGGSDPTSGLAANPLIGALSDRVVAQGGTAILSETTEFIGAEHILAARAVNQEIHDRILEIVYRYEKALALVGEQVREGNPSPGNKAGGITTLEEKSLGCIHKGGCAPVRAVYDYAKQITEHGLVIMDTPGNDPSSVAGMVAGGAQLIVFSSGRGSPVGNPIAPVIKITGNRETYAKMPVNLDVDASPILYGEKTLDEMGDALLELAIAVANGRQPAAERMGFNEIAIARLCNYV